MWSLELEWTFLLFFWTGSTTYHVILLYTHDRKWTFFLLLRCSSIHSQKTCVHFRRDNFEKRPHLILIAMNSLSKCCIAVSNFYSYFPLFSWLCGVGIEATGFHQLSSGSISRKDSNLFSSPKYWPVSCLWDGANFNEANYTDLSTNYNIRDPRGTLIFQSALLLLLLLSNIPIDYIILLQTPITYHFPISKR